MKRILTYNNFTIRVALLVISLTYSFVGYSQHTPSGSTSGYCDPTVPAFVVDLSSNPDSVWLETNTSRNDSCCFQEQDDPCIEFVVSLAPTVAGLYFEFSSPAPSVSASQFYINCTDGPFSVQDTVCLASLVSLPPYTITYCKPGNDKPNYVIAGIGNTDISPPITVSNACTHTIYGTGYVESSIVWNSVFPDNVGDYNGFLYNLQDVQDSIGEDTIVVKPSGVFLTRSLTNCAVILGLSCGSVTSRCDTVWVYFVSDFSVSITPQNPSICVGGGPATLTANPSGGASPYSYQWYYSPTLGGTYTAISGEINQTYDATQELYYMVNVNDTLECNGVFDTVFVSEFTVSITANAGIDDTICISSPTAPLSGTVTGVGANDGVWSSLTGAGTFSPDDTMSTSYTLDAAELAAGFAILQLNSINNLSCPGDSDTVRITVAQLPTASVPGDAEICSDQNAYIIAGAASTNGTVLWSSSGDGSFSSTTIDNPTYSFGTTDLAGGAITLTMDVTGNGSCAPAQDVMNLTVTAAPTAAVPGDAEICSDQNAYIIAGAASTNGTVLWSSLGDGSFSSTTIDNPTYSFGTADLAGGAITLTMDVTGNGSCAPAQDVMNLTITAAPTAVVPGDAEICSDQNAYIIAGAASTNGTVLWSSSGDGSFSSTTIDNPTYSFGTADLAGGAITLTMDVTGNGSCAPAQDVMNLTITAAPTAVVPGDAEICSDQNAYIIAGAASTNGTVLWSSSGDGSFSSTTIDNPTYSFGTTDLAGGAITLTMDVTGNGSCAPAQDVMNLTITAAPTAVVPGDAEICSDQNAYIIAGAASTNGTVLWSSSGDGSFSSTTIDNPTYSFGTTDLAGGAITLTMDVTGNGSCAPAQDVMNLTVTAAPTAAVPGDAEICSDQNAYIIAGAASTNGTVLWSSSGDGSFSSTTIDNPTYSFGTADLAGGAITLTMDVTGNGSCAPAQDVMNLTITAAPTAVVPGDAEICSDQNAYIIAGAASTNGTVLWSSSGDGSFSSTTIDNPTYSFGTADLAGGAITLTMDVTGNGSCAPAQDVMNLTITAAPTAVVPGDAEICSDQNAYIIAGAASTNGTVLWSSSGDGSFSSTTIDNPTYSFGTTDLAGGAITLTMDVTGNGSCAPAQDVMNLTITAAPTAVVPGDAEICSDQNAYIIAGAASTNGTVLWSSSGDGSFSSTTIDNPTYSFGTADLAGGAITLTMDVTGNGSCAPAQDVMNLTITAAPTAVVPGDAEICSDQNAYIIAGAASTNGTVLWSSSGDGSFSSTTIDNPTYSFGTADLAGGAITLTMDVTGNGSCAPAQDVMNLTITAAPTAVVPGDAEICSDQNAYIIAGAASTNGTVLWSSSGDGSFSSTTIDNPTYSFGTADLAGGAITLTMDVTGNGSCAPAQDVMNLTITAAPTAVVPGDAEICSDQNAYIIAGAASTNGTVLWSSSGDGSFSSTTIDNPTYSFGTTDLAGGAITLTMDVTGNGSCAPAQDVMNLTITAAPTAVVPGDAEICSDQNAYIIAGAASTNGTVLWSSSGDGSFSSTTIDNPTYSFGTADLAGGAITLTMDVTGNGSCAPAQDVMNLTITAAPTASASGDWIICEEQNNYTIVGATSSNGPVLWTTSGDGTFLDPTIDNPTYTFGTNDTASGLATLAMTVTGSGSCADAVDVMNLTITDSPSISAGTNDTVCADNPTITLNGSVTIASGGVWISLGSGSFDNSSNLNANYTPSAADIAAGNVSIYITSTGNGGCNPVNDTVDFIIAPIPIVNAGNDTTACPDLAAFQLGGSVINATGGTWSSSGTGTFNDSNIMNPTYTPSPSDTALGSFYAILTSTGNGLCIPVVDSIFIDFKPLPTVFAGNDTVVCIFTPTLPLNGIVANVAGGVWSTPTGTGNFTPNDSTLNGQYNFTSADWTSGGLDIILTSYGGCLAIIDTMRVTVSPFVDAGIDTAVCSGTTSIDIEGSVVGALGLVWSTSGDGTFTPSTTAFNLTYNFGPNDIINGTFDLELESTGNGGCLPARDTVTITILPPPIVNAGNDTTVCRSQGSIALSANSSNVDGVVWSTLGSGTFSPNDSLLNPTYFLSTADTAADSLLLVITTYGGCAIATDTLEINYFPGVLTDAGIDQTVCAADATIPLTGSVVLATGGTWTTSGTGTFDNVNSLTTNYYPTSGDTASGSVSLYMTSTGNGLCIAVTDSLLVDFISEPIVNAGTNDTVCSVTPPNAVNGTSSNTILTAWSTVGTGFFDNSSLLNTNYTPSTPDTANGSIQLVLTGSSSVCPDITDTMLITFADMPEVNAGPDLFGCINLLGEAVSGTINSNVSGFGWTTLGTGSFDPDTLSLSTNYVSTPADTTAGTINIVFVGFGYSTCPSASDTLTIFYDPGPSVDAGNTQSTCADSPIINVSGAVQIATGGVWTTSGTGTFADTLALSTVYTASDADTVSGSVFLYLTTTGNDGCPAATDSLEIIFAPTPFADAGPDDAVCASNPIYVLGGSFGIATGAYWSSTGTGSFGDTLDLATTYFATPADTVAGSVYITLITTGNGLCPATIDTMELTFTPDIISVFAGNDSTICADSVQLNGVVNIALGGLWTTAGSGTFSPNDSLLTANYLFSQADTTTGSVMLYLTTTGNGGCAAQVDSVVYTIQDPLLISASVVDTLCAYPTPVPFLVNVTSGAVIWSTLGDGSFSPSNTDTIGTYTPGATDLSSGQAILISTSQNNGACAAITDTSIITFIQLPTADFSSDQVCALNNTQFTDLSSSPDGITEWWWDFNTGDTSMIQNPTYAFPLGGNISVTLVVTSSIGCVDSVTNIVDIDPTPAAGFISTANCFVDSVVFSDTSFVNIGSISNWDWDFGDGNSDTIPNPINFYPGPGSYDVTLIVTSSDGCVDSIVIATSVNPNPFADFTYIINCVNQPIVFNDASSISNGSITNWDWDFGNTLTSTTQNPNANFTDDISYDVELIVTSDSGCVDTVIHSIIPYSLPTADFDAIGLCLEDGTQFNDLSTVNGSSIVAWEWDFGNGNQTTEQSPEYFYSTSGTYAVTFITESAQGCVDTLQQAITVNPSPTAAFTMSPLIVELFENIVFTDQSTDAVTWDWNFGDGTGTDVSPNPEYSYLDTGLFVTELIIENQYGCPDTATGEIAVVMTPIVPAGFSPDGNGENDILYVLGGPYTSLDFKIYNNWGELIFTSRDQGNGWDGTRDGVDQPIGVYIFTLDAVRLDGTEYKQVHGDITLLR